MIKVLAVDESEETLRAVAAALAQQADIDLVSVVTTGREAVEAIPTLRPDVVVLSMDLPSAAGGTAGPDSAGGIMGMDADSLATADAVGTRFPWISIIMTSSNGDAGQLRRAMLAGARHFLVKPVDDAELVESIRSVFRLDAARRTVHATPTPAAAAASAAGPRPAAALPSRNGKIYTFYSAKGGAGCTTLACNTAIALKQTTDKDVAIFDCGLLFGDVGVVLNLNPRNTIVDLLPHLTSKAAALDPELLGDMMITHASGVKVLLAPASPEKAELVTPDHVHKVLVALREQFDYVVIDTWPTFEERILHVLDAADKIIVPTTLEMPAIKNSKLLMGVTSALAYPPEKVVMVLNRADSRGGIRVQDVERILQKPFAVEVVSDGRLTTHSLNEGVPFVMTNPEAPISRDITKLATLLAGITSASPEDARPRKSPGLLRTVFGS